MDSRPSVIPVFLLVLVCGCQNGGQQDLVVRELRMQEDQLYAMENYLSDYQQLVCKYRSENAALRRQLADRSDASELPTPQDPRTLRARGDGPSLQTPESTPQQQQQDTVPAPGAIEEPSVPPLDTTPGASPPPVDAALYLEGPAKTIATTGQATIKGLASIKPSETGAQNAGQERPRGVSLRGEVLANEDNCGPRLVVDVMPSNLSNETSPFVGTLSLMLLAPEGGEEPRCLARWDFNADEVQAAVDTASESAMRFYLELPADSPLAEPAELWVRLLPQDGGKLLTHAEINLARPSEFSSTSAKPDQPLRDDSLQLTSFDDSPKDVSLNPSTKLTGDWTIARPGEPAKAKSIVSSESEWRASSIEIPVVVKSPDSTGQGSASVQLAILPDSATTPMPPLYKRPTWTAERPSTDSVVPSATSASQPQRPAWSATR